MKNDLRTSNTGKLYDDLITYPRTSQLNYQHYVELQKI